jgi:hypothetical protein
MILVLEDVQPARSALLPHRMPQNLLRKRNHHSMQPDQWSFQKLLQQPLCDTS